MTTYLIPTSLFTFTRPNTPIPFFLRANRLPALLFFTSRENADLYRARGNFDCGIVHIPTRGQLAHFLKGPFEFNSIPDGKSTYNIGLDPIDPNDIQEGLLVSVEDFLAAIDEPPTLKSESPEKRKKK